MKKWILNIALCLSAWNVQAHQTEISSTMLVERNDNQWVLQIRSALTAFDHIIKANYPPYKTAEEFQELVLEHIENNLQITFNKSDKVILKNGAVKLGHETSVVFEVSNVPLHIESIYIKNSSFQSINRNQGALILLKKGFKKKQFILNAKNDYNLDLQAVNNEFVPTDPTIVVSKAISNDKYAGIIVGLVGMLAIVFLRIRRKKQQLV